MKKELTTGIEFGFRFFACVLFCIYGVAKTVQFGGGEKFPDDFVHPDMSGQDVMWLFFGYSLVYPLIIGAFQVIGGLMLLFERTKLIGVLILLPIVSNIILLDLVYEVHAGATLNATVLLFSLFVIMYWERKKVVHVLLILIRKSGNQSIKEKSIPVVIGMLFSVLLFGIVWYIGTHLL